jgi:NNP family nitrate/nitrite transporter-like MFS transporter
MDPAIPKLVAALRLPLTWQMSFLYAVCFGGFVAFTTYLPTYLKDIYNFNLTEAGTRTAGFALAAVVARPMGGVLSDRVTPNLWCSCPSRAPPSCRSLSRPSRSPSSPQVPHS